MSEISDDMVLLAQKVFETVLYDATAPATNMSRVRDENHFRLTWAINAIAPFLIAAERERCAKIAREAWKVTVDDGIPSEEVTDLCQEIEEAIRSAP
jgi:hypothetical protein